jgi:hypothetical protein
MNKAIIFNSEQEAKNADYHYNDLTGSVTKYYFNRKPLKDTHTYTKSEWAELYNIPVTIAYEEGNETPNPQYEALDDSYTVQKCALMVADYLDVYDDKGNVVKYALPWDHNITFDVVEIPEEDFYVASEE